jgi:hypothetical protein
MSMSKELVGLLIFSVIAGCAAPQPVYVLAPGQAPPPGATVMAAPPPGAAPAPAPDPGPSTAEKVLGVIGAVATGIGAPGRHERMQTWLNLNAASIATCLHGSASSKGEYEILAEDPATSTTKARIKWSGWGWFGGDHYSDVSIAVSGDLSNTIATVTVLSEDSNFDPDDSCEYLHGKPMQ